jgi:hypothetical protein
MGVPNFLGCQIYCDTGTVSGSCPKTLSVRTIHVNDDHYLHHDNYYTRNPITAIKPHARGTRVNNHGELLARIAIIQVYFFIRRPVPKCISFLAYTLYYRWRVRNCQSYCSGGNNTALIQDLDRSIVFGTIIAPMMS